MLFLPVGGIMQGKLLPEPVLLGAKHGELRFGRAVLRGKRAQLGKGLLIRCDRLLKRGDLSGFVVTAGV